MTENIGYRTQQRVPENRIILVLNPDPVCSTALTHSTMAANELSVAESKKGWHVLRFLFIFETKPACRLRRQIYLVNSYYTVDSYDRLDSELSTLLRFKALLIVQIVLKVFVLCQKKVLIFQRWMHLI